MAKETRVGLRVWEWAVIFLAWAVTCGCVWLIGFYLGRNSQDHPLGNEERIVRLPVTSAPPAAGQRGKAESEFQFYSELPGEERAPHGPETVPAPTKTTLPATPPPTTKPAPGPVTPPSPPATVPSTTLPKPTASPTTTTMRTPAAPTASTLAPLPAASLPSSRVLTSTTTTTPPVARPAPSTTTPTSHLPAPPTTLPPVAVQGTTDGAGGGWTVQVNPTRSRDEADTLAQQLHTRGYDAVTVRIQRDGDTWYRVRVGHYASSQDAAKIMQRLRDQEGVPHAFVASE